MQQSVPMQRSESIARVNTFVRGVYLWMTIGLAITGFTAWFVANSPYLLSLLIQPTPEGGARFTLAFWALMIAPIALSITLQARIQKIKASTATFMFLLYAVLMGAFLSLILLIYSGSSIAHVFFICSGTFLACSIFGWTTKKDLTSVGSFMAMGVLGLFIAHIANIFMQSPMIFMVTSYIGVFVFVGLTAYETQKLKAMALSQPADLDAATLRKGTIMGALDLYINFIMLFIYLLRIFGSRD